VRWNRTYNLTAIRYPHEMVTRHLLDSLAMVPHVESGTLADLGTGPGLPGIPLAIARPQLQVTLVESNGKKARFLREAVRQLGLGNARVAESRAEALDEPAAYDNLTARAMDTLAGIVAVGGHLLRPGGHLLAMKGVYPHEEIAALPADWHVLEVRPLPVRRGWSASATWWCAAAGAPGRTASRPPSTRSGIRASFRPSWAGPGAAMAGSAAIVPAESRRPGCPQLNVAANPPSASG